MSFSLENFKNKPPIVVINDDDIKGISFFKKRLEQLFFSDVIIRNSDVDGKQGKLIIELSCNFSLKEGMSQLTEGIWGRLQQTPHQNFQESAFYKLVLQLEEKNTFAIEVEELCLLFSDCNIIINKLYKHSISEQLDAILMKLAYNYSELTEGMCQVPYEIFIPVFEDNNFYTDTQNLVPSCASQDYGVNNYFDFWGLYYNNHEDAFMYSPKKRTIIRGDLNMLND